MIFCLVSAGIVFGLFKYNANRSVASGQEYTRDLISKGIFAIINKDKDAYLECHLAKDRVFAEAIFEFDCLHREFIQKLREIYGPDAWERYKEIKVGRSWVFQSSTDCVLTENDVVKFIQDTPVYFCSEKKALWDPPVGVVALINRRGSWYFNPKESCDIKSTINLFRWNNDVYKKVIPKIHSSEQPLEELKIEIMDVYYDD